jgi:hypothetical protein
MTMTMTTMTSMTMVIVTTIAVTVITTVTTTGKAAGRDGKSVPGTPERTAMSSHHRVTAPSVVWSWPA